MPLYKRLANRALTRFENGVLKTELTDLHTGYRAYSRGLLLDRALPAKLPRLQLRFRAAHAGIPLRLPHRGGAGAPPPFRRRLLGWLRRLHRLRA